MSRIVLDETTGLGKLTHKTQCSHSLKQLSIQMGPTPKPAIKKAHLWKRPRSPPFQMSHAKERTVNQESVDIWAKSFVEIKTIQAEGKNWKTIMDIFREITEDKSIMKQLEKKMTSEIKKNLLEITKIITQMKNLVRGL